MIKAYDRILETFERFDTSKIKEIGRLTPTAFIRDRKLPFKDMLRLVLSQKGRTITMEINNYFKEIHKREERVTKQAFSKQRCLLNPEVFVHLNHEYVESLYKTGYYKTYKGYILTAIDGTILEIPNTKELQREYECLCPTSQDVRKSARAKASGIYDVENNIMIDAIIDKYTTTERSMAKRNIESMLKVIGKDKKVVTIFDRGYISIEMLVYLMSEQMFFIFRVPGDKYKEEKASMKSDDEIIDIEINRGRLAYISDEAIKLKAKQMKNVKVRMIRLTLSTGEVEYLITNIPSNEVDTKELSQIYFKRWGIETAYDVIKNKLCIENFSGRKKVVLEQDFHAQMLLFNMVEDLKNDANKDLEKNKNSTLKYEYKVNVNILVGTFREYMIKIAIEEDTLKRKQLYEYMLEEIMENLVPIRPNRNNARNHYRGRNKNRLNIRRNS